MRKRIIARDTNNVHCSLCNSYRLKRFIFCILGTIHSVNTRTNMPNKLILSVSILWNVYFFPKVRATKQTVFVILLKNLSTRQFKVLPKRSNLTFSVFYKEKFSKRVITKNNVLSFIIPFNPYNPRAKGSKVKICFMDRGIEIGANI